MLSPGTKSTLQKLMSLLAATLGRCVAVGLMDSGRLGVVLPCASARCSRLPPEVFDDCSCLLSQAFSLGSGNYQGNERELF